MDPNQARDLQRIKERQEKKRLAEFDAMKSDVIGAMRNKRQPQVTSSAGVGPVELGEGAIGLAFIGFALYIWVLATKHGAVHYLWFIPWLALGMGFVWVRETVSYGVRLFFYTMVVVVGGLWLLYLSG